MQRRMPGWQLRGGNPTKSSQEAENCLRKEASDQPFHWVDIMLLSSLLYLASPRSFRRFLFHSLCCRASPMCFRRFLFHSLLLQSESDVFPALHFITGILRVRCVSGASYFIHPYCKASSKCFRRFEGHGPTNEQELLTAQGL